jgi:hypothetical protein
LRHTDFYPRPNSVSEIPLKKAIPLSFHNAFHWLNPISWVEMGILHSFPSHHFQSVWQEVLLFNPHPLPLYCISDPFGYKHYNTNTTYLQL